MVQMHYLLLTSCAMPGSYSSCAHLGSGSTTYSEETWVGESITLSPIAMAAMVYLPGVENVIGSVYKIEPPESREGSAESTIE